MSTHSYLITMNGVAAELSAARSREHRALCPASPASVRAGESTRRRPTTAPNSSVRRASGTAAPFRAASARAVRASSSATSIPASTRPHPVVRRRSDLRRVRPHQPQAPQLVDCLTDESAPAVHRHRPRSQRRQRTRRAYREHGGRQHARWNGNSAAGRSRRRSRRCPASRRARAFARTRSCATNNCTVRRSRPRPRTRSPTRST